MNAFSRRGACPALSAPMETGDGLLVRLNPLAGGFSPKTLIGLCEAASRHGNGVVEVTARGSFQIRGLGEESARLLAIEIDAMGIPVRTGVPVETGPLAGLDPDEIADARPLAERIRRVIGMAGLDGKLGPKVSVVVDGCGHSGLDKAAADVRLTAEREGRQVLWQVAVTGDAETAALVAMAMEDGACDLVVAILERIAALGRDARAKDLTTESLAAVGSPPQGRRPTLPPSVLPDTSPARGEIIRGGAGTLSSDIADWRKPTRPPISPLVGEMSGRTEGGAKECKHLLDILALSDGRFALGIALPFGHTDAATLIAFAKLAEALGIPEIRLAPKRTILALCASQGSALGLQREATHLGFVTSPTDPRRSIAACPGAPACASGHIAAREIAARIAAEHGDLLDGSFALHVSGCAKGCAHPAEAALTLVGSENGAGIVVAGTARGTPLAYTAAKDTAGGFGRLAALVGSKARHGARGETTAACLARLGEAEIAAAFEGKGAGAEGR